MEETAFVQQVPVRVVCTLLHFCSLWLK